MEGGGLMCEEEFKNSYFYTVCMYMGSWDSLSTFFVKLNHVSFQMIFHLEKLEYLETFLLETARF